MSIFYTNPSSVNPGFNITQNIGSNPVNSDGSSPNNYQKPTFYPFASGIAGNTQDPHDNSATTVFVANDASSVRSGLFNFLTGKWNNTYVPTTYRYGICENRDDSVTYTAQDQEYSINTVDLSSCDQSTLILPAITPLPVTPLVTGFFNVGDPAFAYSDITSNLTFRGSIYLDTNNSSTAYEIAEIFFAMNVDVNGLGYDRCNDAPSASRTAALVLSTSDNSLKYYSAKTFTSDDYMDTVTRGFNSSGSWGHGTNTLLPEPIRDRGQLRFDIYTDCDFRAPYEFGIDTNTWDTSTFATDYANGLYNDRVFMKRFSPELVEHLKTSIYHYFYGYNGDFSEFNFDTDTGWRLDINPYNESPSHMSYEGHYFNIFGNNTVTSIDFSATDVAYLYISSSPNFTHLENVANYSWLSRKNVSKTTGQISSPQGIRLQFDRVPITQQNFNDIIDSVYQRVVIDRPYAADGEELRLGNLTFGSSFYPMSLTVDSTRQAKIDAITEAPYVWKVTLNSTNL